MPLYEYICENCGQQFEKLVRLSEADLAPQCPFCGSSETHKQISRLASGFGGFDGGSFSSGSCSGSGGFS